MSTWVRRLKSNDAQAWERLVEVYAPLVHFITTKTGLAGEAAETVTANVLFKVFLNIERFEKRAAAGGFRAWLKTITKREVANLLADRGKTQLLGDAAEDVCVEAVDALSEQEWDEAQRQARCRRCAKIMELVRREFQPQTAAAFEQHGLRGRKASDVASELGMSVNAVYLARFRVLKWLRELGPELFLDDS